MELADEETCRALGFLAAVSSQGYAPTSDELDAFLAAPHRRRGTVYPTGAVQALEAIQGMVHQATKWMSTTSAETMAEYLERLQWAVVAVGRIYLTDLGRAVVRSVDDASTATDASVALVLDPDDPIVLARLMDRLGLLGAGMLVEPYFRISELLPVMQVTAVTRVLTSTRTARSERQAVALAVEQLEIPGRRFEVRVAGRELHDRHFMADDGKVVFLGASINGVGRVLTALGELKDSASEVRDAYEVLWKDADPLAVLEERVETGSVRDEGRRQAPKKDAR